MTIWERVEDALDGLGLPVAAGVMLQASGESLPDAYLVYFLIADPPAQHADDAETLRNHHVQVSAYSRSGLSTLPDIAGAMVAAGFTRGPRRELPYNQSTRHFGLALEFWFLEEE
jgi:hypothetical protein